MKRKTILCALVGAVLGLPCTAVCIRNFNGQYSVRLESVVHC